MRKKSRWRIFLILICISLFASLIFTYKIDIDFNSNENFEFKSNCSIFTVKNSSSVFFGNNEDEGGLRRRTDIWFVPSTNTEYYGCVYLGFAENAPGGDDVDSIGIGGMNTQGLCYDGNGILPEEYVESVDELGPPLSYLTCREQILRECSTVEEVIQWYRTHNLGGWWWGQGHWADSSGDAMVVSPALNGSLAFTRINGSYLISTNFNVDHPSGTYYPCDRYETMTIMLDDMILTNNVTLDNCAAVLEEVHVPSPIAGTLYSNVFDLKKQIIYLYIHGNYENIVTLNLSTELEKGYHGYEINNLQENSLDDLFSNSGLWPINPKISQSHIIILCSLISLPLILTLIKWSYSFSKVRKNKIQGGKTNFD